MAGWQDNERRGAIRKGRAGTHSEKGRYMYKAVIEYKAGKYKRQ